MAISAQQVQDLRKLTGAGIMECKKALIQTSGDINKAVNVLRTMGQARATQLAGTSTTAGIVESYVHKSGKGARVGVLVQLGCQTDFVASTPEFQQLAHDIALQIAGMPGTKYISVPDVPASEVANEVSIYTNQALAEGKPAARVPQIVEGQLKKFYSQVCLLEQAWIKDNKTKIRDLINQYIASTKENIEVKTISRVAIGEKGIFFE